MQASGSAEDISYIEGTGTVTFIRPEDRELAPEFTGPLLDGGKFNLAEISGNVVVLNVWGS